MNAQKNERLVGISISSSPDLARLGFGAEHLHELMIAVARTLLRVGTADQPMHLAYGGDLRPGGFTETLFDLFRTEAQSGRESRLYSYLAWPYYLDLSKGDEASRLNICHFLRVTPADAGFRQYPADQTQEGLDDAVRALLTARCISKLREVMTGGGKTQIDGKPAPPLDARIILGGKVTGYTGIMPGIFEEFMLAQENNQKNPVSIFIAGGLGGASAALADAVLRDRTKKLKAITLDYQKKHTKGLAELEKQYLEDPGIDEAQARYARLEVAIEQYRTDLQQPQGKPPTASNGLTLAENKRLMRSQSVGEITGLIELGLRRRWFGAV